MKSVWVLIKGDDCVIEDVEIFGTKHGAAIKAQGLYGEWYDACAEEFAQKGLKFDIPEFAQICIANDMIVEKEIL